ncbi:MAG TPA: CoA transferase, partial [Deltaproteobacteria bacterium]|nr:CoA transferase [Deltaproteobacteria bacterium]
PNVAPYEPMPASDGWVLLAAGNDAQWERMLALPEFAALRGQERWATNNQRVADRAALAEALAPIFETRTREDWIELLRGIRVPAGPILRPDEALQHPQTLAAGMLITMNHPTVGAFHGVGSPYHFSETPVTDYASAPLLGADTDAILEGALGMDSAAIQALRAKAVIR